MSSAKTTVTTDKGMRGTTDVVGTVRANIPYSCVASVGD